nr:integrase, catalytic region, zinc finger, CCHC-type, peptidase aspartic, catalytic [Tanacetum cinerariifolium]
MTFSNPLFNSNDDFTSNGDESLSDEDVPKDNVLENIENKDSYDSNLDESDLLVTLLSDANKNECIDSGVDDDEINVLDCEDSYYDSKGDILYLESMLNDDLVHHDPSIPAMSVTSNLEGFTDEPPLEENDDLFDLESKNDEWKNIFYDAQIDDLMSEDKNFDLGICVKKISLTYLVEIVLFIVDSGCSKHMTRNLKLLINFVEKFPGTVKFGNDQIAPILGYGDRCNDKEGLLC